ncbi:glucosyltransferase domain-containing protein [Kosakonia sp. H02]|nr:glucosyltransferase domain-containing protein [Kosakonia sp. H02]
MNKYKNSIIIYLSALFSSLIVYGYELTNFTMSVDEEFSDNFNNTISLGRWGHAFLKVFILPEPYVPFFTTLLSLAALSLAAFLTARLLKLDTFNASILAVLYISLPQFAYQLEFSNQSDTVSIALVASTLAVHYFLKGKQRILSFRTFIAVVLYTLSISVYQSFAILPIVIYIAYITTENIRARYTIADNLMNLIRFGAIAATATIIYYCLNGYIQSKLGLSSTYLQNKVGWDFSDINNSIVQDIEYVISYFNGRSYFGLKIYSTTMLAYGVVVAKLFMRRQITTSNLLLPALLLISPMIMIAALCSNLPPRTMLGLSVSFSVIITLSLMDIHSNAVKIGVAAIALAIGCANSSKLFYSDMMAYKSDSNNARFIMQSIYNKYPDFSPSKTPVYFYGGYYTVKTWKIDNSDTFGGTIFSWNGGVNKRIHEFLRAEGIADLKMIAPKDVNKFRGYAVNHPQWPHDDSVQLKDGVLIVRLGRLPGRD